VSAPVRGCSFYIPHQVGSRGSCSLPLHPSVLGPRGSCSLPLHPSVLFGRNQRSLPDTCSIHSQQSIPLSLALSLCQCRSSHLVLGPFSSTSLNGSGTKYHTSSSVVVAESSSLPSPNSFIRLVHTRTVISASPRSVKASLASARGRFCGILRT